MLVCPLPLELLLVVLDTPVARLVVLLVGWLPVVGLRLDTRLVAPGLVDLDSETGLLRVFPATGLSGFGFLEFVLLTLVARLLVFAAAESFARLLVLRLLVRLD